MMTEMNSQTEYTRNQTLLAYLDAHARNTPDKTAYSFVDKHCNVENSLTYAELDQLSNVLANQILNEAPKAESAILVFPQCLEFIVTYLACFKAGIIAVPVSVPNKQHGIVPLESIAEDSGAKIIMTTSDVYERFTQIFNESFLMRHATWRTVSITELRNSCINQGNEISALPNRLGQVAMLQYTSGSTGIPKGVIVSHQNIDANQKMINKGFGLHKDDIVASWLPLYHDMGLIGVILQSLFVGSTCHLISPATFARNPLIWLRLISNYGVTISGAPNFGYEVCIKRVKEKDQDGLELSRWRCAFNGAEPIRATTLDRFAEKFSRNGFSKHSFLPCYGMAETTLLATCRTPDRPYKANSFSAKLLEEKVSKEVVNIESNNKRTIVCCGSPAQGSEVIIVDPESHTRLEEGRIGEIWVAGPHVAKGYWKRQTMTESTFMASTRDNRWKHYLRTGDLGFLLDGELYVTGRLKDMLIINGRNIYPNDIEQYVDENFDQVNSAGVGVFQVENQGKEQAVIVSETTLSEKNQEARKELADLIKEKVSNTFNMAVSDVYLIKRNTIPKTTSGKIQRSKLRNLYENSELQRYRYVSNRIEINSANSQEGKIT